MVENSGGVDGENLWRLIEAGRGLQIGGSWLFEGNHRIRV